MRKEELYQIVDAILNQASFDDLEVIAEALKRRRGDGGGTMLGFAPERLSREMAAGMEGQLASTREMIRHSVTGFVEKMIRSEAPELSDAQVRELMAAWLPASSGPDSSRKSGKSTGSKRSFNNPKHRQLLETMVWQFIDFSIGGMPSAQQRELESELGDWTRRYWDQFPEEIRQLIALFLKGAMEQDQFEGALKEALEEPSGGGS